MLITTSSDVIHSLKGYISQYPTPSLHLKSRRFHLSTGDACDAEFLIRSAGIYDERGGEKAGSHGGFAVKWCF